ncbi:MAG: DUF421 domain-containing protein [Clostridia bacterium]|jgi:uncharacterized membrane protein YcaP (DUF421 family)|nr:DUF421 domain-containing protein [Clostridia bacterium]
MLNLFLRTILLYLFLLLILRLTGKRQVADLEPSDLIVTLVIADVGSNAISDTNIPLLYSVVPILALYLVQQLIAKACLKSDRIRAIICGNPQYLIRDGVMQEETMRGTNYAIRDLIEHLREKDVFDLAEVTDAILESNGSLSVRLKPEELPPTRRELNVRPPKSERPELLIREGDPCPEGMRESGITDHRLSLLLNKEGLHAENVFYAQRSTDGTIRLQTFRKDGARIRTVREGGSK